jgi:hypothetical protein
LLTEATLTLEIVGGCDSFTCTVIVTVHEALPALALAVCVEVEVTFA